MKLDLCLVFLGCLLTLANGQAPVLTGYDTFWEPPMFTFFEGVIDSSIVSPGPYFRIYGRIFPDRASFGVVCRIKYDSGAFSNNTWCGVGFSVSPAMTVSGTPSDSVIAWLNTTSGVVTVNDFTLGTTKTLVQASCVPGSGSASVCLDTTLGTSNFTCTNALTGVTSSWVQRTPTEWFLTFTFTRPLVSSDNPLCDRNIVLNTDMYLLGAIGPSLRANAYPYNLGYSSSLFHAIRGGQNSPIRFNVTATVDPTTQIQTTQAVTTQQQQQTTSMQTTGVLQSTTGIVSSTASQTTQQQSTGVPPLVSTGVSAPPSQQSSIKVSLTRSQVVGYGIGTLIVILFIVITTCVVCFVFHRRGKDGQYIRGLRDSPESAEERVHLSPMKEGKKAETLDELLHTPVAQVIPKKQKLVYVKSNDLLPNVFKALIEKNIYSVPVMEKNTFTGFVDLVDLVTFIVEIFSETELLGEDFDLFLIEEKQKKFSKEHAESVKDLSKRNPLHTISEEETILKALEIFQTTGTHRVAVSDKPHGEIVNVITQSAIISWLEENLKLLGEDGKKTVQFFFHFDKPVFSIQSTDKAIEAFKLMAKNRVSAVAVLNDDGSFLTTITAKDIRILESKVLFNRLYLPAQEFASVAHKNETLSSLTVKPLSTLVDVITKLSAHKRHRVFVVDEAKKPVGVISLGDVLNAVLKIFKDS